LIDAHQINRDLRNKVHELEEKLRSMGGTNATKQYVDPAITAAVGESAVEHPAHYTFSKIEVIEAIEEWGLNYRLGNVVKYIARADHKRNRLEDLKKALFYLSREIEKSSDDK
jgi:hypothetical protein